MNATFCSQFALNRYLTIPLLASQDLRDPLTDQAGVWMIERSLSGKCRLEADYDPPVAARDFILGTAEINAHVLELVRMVENDAEKASTRAMSRS